MSANKLINLPPEIAMMTDLCQLDLSHNELRELPTELAQIKTLRNEGCQILLNGNPLISPPEEIVAQGTVAILDYLENKAAWHLQPLVLPMSIAIGLLTTLILALLWRRRSYAKKKRG